MNTPFIFHIAHCFLIKKHNQTVLKTWALAEQLNGGRLSIKKTKPLSFGGKREKKLRCFNSYFSSDVSITLKSAKKHYILTTGSLFLVGSENKGGLFAYIVSSTWSGEGHSGCWGVWGLCLYTRFSVETQGTGVKTDIHLRGKGLILWTQSGYRLLRIWCVEAWFWSAVHLDQPDIFITPLLKNHNSRHLWEPFSVNIA